VTWPVIERTTSPDATCRDEVVEGSAQPVDGLAPRDAARGEGTAERLAERRGDEERSFARREDPILREAGVMLRLESAAPLFEDRATP
jgi:hypothetical protein